MVDPPDLDDQDFITAITGGAWCMEAKGRAIDGAKCAARSEQAKECCRNLGLRQSASFDLELYERSASFALCAGWADRMLYVMVGYKEFEGQTGSPEWRAYLGEWVVPPAVKLLEAKTSRVTKEGKKVLIRLQQIKAVGAGSPSSSSGAEAAS